MLKTIPIPILSSTTLVKLRIFYRLCSFELGVGSWDRGCTLLSTHMLGPAVLVVMPAADGEVASDVEPLRHGHGRGLVAVHGDGQEVAPFHHLHLLTIMMSV